MVAGVSRNGSALCKHRLTLWCRQNRADFKASPSVSRPLLYSLHTPDSGPLISFSLPVLYSLPSSSPRPSFSRFAVLNSRFSVIFISSLVFFSLVCTLLVFLSNFPRLNIRRSVSSLTPRQDGLSAVARRGAHVSLAATFKWRSVVIPTRRLIDRLGSREQ